MTVRRTTISGDTAAHGGGIDASGAADIDESTIADNSAVRGGGILTTSGTLTLTRSTVEGNAAQGRCATPTVGICGTAPCWKTKLKSHTYRDRRPHGRRPAPEQRRPLLECVLREHGGLGGIRDENALGSALPRPKQHWHYALKSDVPSVAAAYGWGLAKNHPYRDGNKRVAFLVMATFLELNVWTLDATEAEVVGVMLTVAGGKRSEEELADWIRAHAGRRRRT